MHIATGEPPSSIGSIADKLDADVVILGRGRTNAAVMHDRPIGGTAYAVMSRSRAPCLAISEPLNLPIRNALVAIDRSDSARGALLVALSWVSALRGGRPGEEYPTLTALYVDPGRAMARPGARLNKKRSSMNSTFSVGTPRHGQASPSSAKPSRERPRDSDRELRAGAWVRARGSGDPGTGTSRSRRRLGFGVSHDPTVDTRIAGAAGSLARSRERHRLFLTPSPGLKKHSTNCDWIGEIEVLLRTQHAQQIEASSMPFSCQLHR